jgi:hypothetical protein
MLSFKDSIGTTWTLIYIDASQYNTELLWNTILRAFFCHYDQSVKSKCNDMMDTTSRNKFKGVSGLV